jgi:dGTPase
MLFERYLKDIESENRSSVIYDSFLKDMSNEYMENHGPGEIARDFIAGMTDQYFLRQCPDNMLPEAQLFL